jgi:hypothetical protein
MKYLSTLLLTICITHVSAQTVLLEREEDGVMDSTIVSIFEEEESKALLLLNNYSLSFPVTQSEPGAAIHNGKSLQFSLGSGYLFKIANVLAAGLSISYNYYNYNIKQDDEKVFPFPFSENKKETFRLHCIQYGPSLRIDFMPERRRAEHTLDLGADMVWVPWRNHKTWNENEDGSEVEVFTRKLPYTETFHYMAYARYVVGIVGIYASYRLTDVFKPEYAYPELPLLNIGIALSAKQL